MVIKVSGMFTKSTTYIQLQNAAEVGRQERPDSRLHIVCGQPPDEQDEHQQVGKWNSHVKHLHIHEKTKMGSSA